MAPKQRVLTHFGPIQREPTGLAVDGTFCLGKTGHIMIKAARLASGHINVQGLIEDTEFQGYALEYVTNHNLFGTSQRLYPYSDLHGQDGWSTVPMKGALMLHAHKLDKGQVSEFLIDCKVDFDHLDPPGLLSSLQEWLDQHCEQAFFGLAKTRNVVQGVIRTRSWSTCTEVKTSLCSTFLRKAHGSTAVYQTSDPSFPTYRDALGLCQLHRLEPGFQELRHKISDADLQEGVNCYLQMGECDSMKGKIVLAPETALSQAVTFHHFMALPANIGLRETLVKMHRSGRYIPDVKLVASIPVDKAESIFKMCISPDTVSLQDIDCVYFDAQPDIPTQKTQPTAATQNRAGSILEGLDLF